jgi:hypothetical protein
MIMDKATKEHVETLVAMPFREFLDVAAAWKEEEGVDFSEIDPTKCPVHQYAMQNGRCLDVTGHTELCPVCDNPMCPTCGSHCVDQISRITGYMQAVSGWNAAKKQEFEDRTRYRTPDAGIV